MGRRNGRGKKIIVPAAVLALLTGWCMRMGLAIAGATAIAIPVLDAAVGRRGALGSGPAVAAVCIWTANSGAGVDRNFLHDREVCFFQS